MGGGRKDMNKMMKQVQKMQQDMQQAQEELAKETVTGSAGGGAVKVTATGSMEITGVEIDPGVVDPEDVEMLQDLVLAATKEAMANAQELSSQRMGDITGGMGDMGIPGL
jgi:DNA-binding YbaB/EbfC family protein